MRIGRVQRGIGGASGAFASRRSPASIPVARRTARRLFVEAKLVASQLDRPLLLEEGYGFGDLSIGRIGVVGRFVPAFYQASPDAQPEMLLSA